jgi:hypothetical protein
MKGQVAGICNLVKVAEEVLRGENLREAELQNFSNKAKDLTRKFTWKFRADSRTEGLKG